MHSVSRIILVGAGPRALGFLERFVALFRNSDMDQESELVFIDPGEAGCGVHLIQQPSVLLTNTVASQITLFSDETVRNAGPVVKGPSFHEWAKEKTGNPMGEKSVSARSAKTEIGPDDYLSRKMLGLYLRDMFHFLSSALPERLRLTVLRQKVDDIDRVGARYSVTLHDGSSLMADHVILCTGHGENALSEDDNALLQEISSLRLKNRSLSFIPNTASFYELNDISHDDVVGIRGMGLTAHDVIAELTQGRGGVFCENDGALSYRPSGREPKMVLFSRQGVPFSARAKNQKGVSGQWQAIFFTRNWIDALRKKKIDEQGVSQLNFFEELWPRIRQEMALMHALTRKASPFGSRLHAIEIEPEDYAAIDVLVNPAANVQLDTMSAYRQSVLTNMAHDLRHAMAGNVADPVKAATDILRDIRDNLRYAVEFGGLTPESHRAFLEKFCPVMNLIAVGPPLSRNRELMALSDAGLISFGPGPSPALTLDREEAVFVLRSTKLRKPQTARFDVLVNAKIDPFFPKRDTSTLMDNLLRKGLVRPYRNGDFHPGGIDINRNNQAIDASGMAHPGLWALGNPTEGPNFYTFILPRPMVNSRSIQDAAHCARQILDDMKHTMAKNRRKKRMAAHAS